MQQDKQSQQNKSFASNVLAVALLIICAAIGMLFYGQHIMATATQGMGKLAAKHLTYEIPNALILLEARRGPCATIPITSEELMKGERLSKQRTARPGLQASPESLSRSYTPTVTRTTIE
ncbi:hypothetical protein N5K55_03745 (plasmid) [Pseudomonas aeruginosa]|nr:hypothetical protein [Pseudomonas aeruginosa]